MGLANRVALDTNVLMGVYLLKVRVFEQIKNELGLVEFIVPKQVEAELNELMEKNKKMRKAATLAKELMAENRVKTVEVDAKNADEALLQLSSSAVVATNDKKLKKRISEKKGMVFFLRQKKFMKKL